MAKIIIPGEQQEEKLVRRPRKSERFIVSAAAQVMDQDALGAKELAFMSRCFVQATLPHSDPGDVSVWGRRNGEYTLTIQPKIVLGKDLEPINYGVPYGSIPRVLLAWLCGEVVRTGSREIILGGSLSEFLEKLGYGVRGGARGDITRVKEQALRLFSSRLSLTYAGDGMLAFEDALLADRGVYFWEPREAALGKKTFWDSQLRLSEAFYNSVRQAPIPLDWRIVRALKQSPMALDLYMWLTHRNFHLEKAISISWKALHAQFGSEYTRLIDFRVKVRACLRKIQAVWPSLKIDATSSERLTLSPSPLLLPKRHM